MKPMNDLLLVRKIEKDAKGLYFGDENKPEIVEILAFSDNCENKNFEVGKKIYIRKYEHIPNGDSDNEFFISEKAVISMF